ncbi:MAG TPA: hypothetical protein PLP29_06665 [Candidatus Ozemobacteraceae bacterium]|nr:hypothetical protein [Candidatus Ozemobacteraceae bacterium]
MKSLFRTGWCLVLIASLVFQAAPQVFAQSCDVYGILNQIHANLEAARCTIAHGGGYMALQAANRPLDNVKSIAGSYPFARCYPGLAGEIRRGADKAKLQLLWHDEGDALEIVNRLLGTVERAQANPAGHAGGRSRSGAGALVAAPVAAGLGALLWGLFRGWNWGMVSNGGNGFQLSNIRGHLTVPTR